MRDASQIRKQIGPALWLFVLLARSVPVEWTGDAAVYVAGGKVIADAELAEHLGVSQGTIAEWRRRLRAAGLIGWLVAPGQGRAFWIAALPQAIPPRAEQDPTLAAPSALTPEILQAVQQRAISLTGKFLQDLSTEEGSRLASVLAGDSLPTKVPE